MSTRSGRYSGRTYLHAEQLFHAHENRDCRVLHDGNGIERRVSNEGGDRLVRSRPVLALARRAGGGRVINMPVSSV